MMLQLLFVTSYSTLNALMKAIQAYAIAKDYVIVKSRSKASYKSSRVAKVDIICERNNMSRRCKSTIKQRKIVNIKIDCSFKINVIYKQSLNVWTTNVRNKKLNYKNDKMLNDFATTRKKNKTTNLLNYIDVAIRFDNIVALYLLRALLINTLLDAILREILSEYRLQNLDNLLTN